MFSLFVGFGEAEPGGAQGGVVGDGFLVIHLGGLIVSGQGGEDA